MATPPEVDGEIGVSEIVMAPPGVSTGPLIAKSEAELAG